MNNCIDSKYIGHNREEEINELENLSNIFVIVSDYDEDRKILTSRISFLPFLNLVSTILIVPFIILFIIPFFLNEKNLENLNSILPFNSVYMILAFFLILLLRIIYNAKLYSYYINRIEIDFVNETLVIKNISIFGKYFIKDKYLKFNEIRKIRTKIVGWATRRRKLLIVETKDDVENVLFLLMRNRSFRKKEKRIVDLLNYILKV